MNNCIRTSVLILLLMGFFGCSTDTTSIGKQSSLQPAQSYQTSAHAVGVSIDVKKSTLHWKGTKMGGLRSHEGTVPLKDGRLFFEKNKLVGGYIIADMNGIGITDIPKHETTAIRNLTNHLKSEFNTQRYSTSKFEITRVVSHSEDSLTVWGNMSIKDVTKNIAVPLKISTSAGGSRTYQTSFVLDRFAWNIGENGSWLEKRVVDADFSVKLNIIPAQSQL